jgi:hypothetical protein
MAQQLVRDLQVLFVLRSNMMSFLKIRLQEVERHTEATFELRLKR